MGFKLPPSLPLVASFSRFVNKANISYHLIMLGPPNLTDIDRWQPSSRSQGILSDHSQLQRNGYGQASGRRFLRVPALSSILLLILSEVSLSDNLVTVYILPSVYILVVHQARLTSGISLVILSRFSQLMVLLQSKHIGSAGCYKLRLEK